MKFIFFLVSVLASTVLPLNLKAQVNYQNLLEKIAEQAGDNYDTTINQEFNYLEMVMKDTVVNFFTVVKGMQTDININGEQDVMNKKHYINSGYHKGHSGTKQSKALFIHRGTFLTDFAKSFIAKFFLLRKMPQLANKIPPSFCADTRVKMEEYEDTYTALPIANTADNLIGFRNTKKTNYTNDYNNNTKWKKFNRVEHSFYFVEPIDNAVCKKLTVYFISNGTETYESISYETYKKFNNKYVQDSLIMKTISIAELDQCGANGTGEYTYLFCEKKMPISAAVAESNIASGYQEFDRAKYFDEFTSKVSTVPEKDETLRKYIIDYLNFLKAKYI